MKPKRTTLFVLLIGCLGGLVEGRIGFAQPASSVENIAASPFPGKTDRRPESGGAGEGGQALLQKAIITLEGHRSIEAKARQRVDLFGKQLLGTGIYLEERCDEGLFLRMELKFPLGEEPCVLLQVCGGRYFWRYEKWLGPPAVTRIDTARVAQSLEEKGDLPQPGKIGNWPGLGGMSRLLRSLNSSLNFETVDVTELPGRFPAFRLEGTWKPDRMAQLLPEQERGKDGALERLQKAPQVPYWIVLFLGRDDLFPYRLEYRRKGSPPASGPALAADAAIATLELFEVRLNAPIARERFFYDPGPLEFTEQTDRFLEGLGVKKR